MLVVSYVVQRFSRYGYELNFVFKKFGNHRCQGYWFVVSAMFPFLKIAVMFTSFQDLGLDQSQPMTGRCHVTCITGVRWEEGISI